MKWVLFNGRAPVGAFEAECLPVVGMLIALQMKHADQGQFIDLQLSGTVTCFMVDMKVDCSQATVLVDVEWETLEPHRADLEPTPPDAGYRTWSDMSRAAATFLEQRNAAKGAG